MAVNDIMDREERPPYVRFERRPVEDRAASIAEGRYVAKDVDFALVTPAYSKDCVEQKVTQFFENAERNARDGRIPERWLDTWRDAFKRWCSGQEVPLNGAAIRGWGIISPAQQEMLIQMNCLTVEDLANADDEGLRRIGMGAHELRNKAKIWLKTLENHGPLTVRLAEVEAENAILHAKVKTLSQQVKILSGPTDAERVVVPIPGYEVLDVQQRTITAADLIDEPAPPARKLRPRVQGEA